MNKRFCDFCGAEISTLVDVDYVTISISYGKRVLNVDSYCTTKIIGASQGSDGRMYNFDICYPCFKNLRYKTEERAKIVNLVAIFVKGDEQ